MRKDCALQVQPINKTCDFRHVTGASVTSSQKKAVFLFDTHLAMYLYKIADQGRREILKTFIVVAAILLTSLVSMAGHPDEDSAVRELYLAYQNGRIPPLELIQPDITWHCAYYQAEKGNYYRASTYLKFYEQRKDLLIRSVMNVTYPRKITATTYYAYSAYGLLSATGDSNVYTSIRQTGPSRMVIEYFEAQSTLSQRPHRAPSHTAPGTAIGYSACVPIN
jgi:hypothetical protein